MDAIDTYSNSTAAIKKTIFYRDKIYIRKSYSYYFL